MIRKTPSVRAFALAAALAAALPGLQAQIAQPLASDPALEKRVEQLGHELRCLVCQNQTISDSNAGLAVDLKNQIREQMQAGRSNKEILDYMVERYGDFVLYRPPLKFTTALLWAGPFILFGLGAAGGVLIVRRRRLQQHPAPLSESQRQRAAQMLADVPETRS